MRVNEAEWAEDCLREYGKILRGRHAHWCPEWDFLPIDENSPEFESCTCIPENERTC